MRTPIGLWTVLTAAAACGTSGPTGGGGGNPPPPTQSVSMGEFSFSPKDVTIKAGTTVVWTNNGTIEHTATSDSPGWDSGPLAPPHPINTCDYPPCGTSPGGTYGFAFTTPGTYPYHCRFHGQSNGMTGTITVTQ